MTQRIIKFRAWDGVRMLQVDKASWGLDGLFHGVTCLLSEIEDVHVMPDNVMQFTGLLDKNGKEIYEGDVVRIQGSNKKEYRIVLIERDGETGGWPVWTMHQKFTEVIGNIYENPGLLTPKE